MMGLEWSNECAKKLGLVIDGRHPLLVGSDATGRTRERVAGEVQEVQA